MPNHNQFKRKWESGDRTVQCSGACSEAVDMNGRFQMQGGKNWFLPKEMNANRFFCDSHWLEIWSNHFYPSMGPNGVSVAMDSGSIAAEKRTTEGFVTRQLRQIAQRRFCFGVKSGAAFSEEYR